MTNLVKYSNLFKQILRPTLRTSYLNYSDKTAKTDAAKGEEYINEDEKEDLTLYLINEDDVESREENINKKRNKSRLLDGDRRRLHQQVPYDEPQSWVHTTLEYQRKMYGRYGAASGVDPRLLFHTPDEAEDLTEYERIAYPHTLEKMIEISKREKEEKEAAIRKRDDEVHKKMGKLNQWMTELNAKMAKKESEAEAIKAKKERAIEEIRRQIGYKLHPKDPRLKELMDQKEEEAKKAKKLAKKQLKEEKILKILQEKSKQLLDEASKEKNSNQKASKTDDEKPTKKDDGGSGN